MADLDPAVTALALQKAPGKHSQKCPVWEHKAPVESCNCWIVGDARQTVAIVAPLIERAVRATTRRVWLFGDPEPEVGTRVLIAGQVWIRHHQLRWILWPGGNGCLGIEWRRLNDKPEFPVVEVLPSDKVKEYGGLILPSTEPL